MLADSFQERIDDLRRMYDLLARIPNGLQPLRELLEAHVKEQGLQAIEKVKADAETDAKVYVDCLLQTHKCYRKLVDTAFSGDATFGASLDKSCRDFVNKNAVTIAARSTAKSPELLAKYCDSLLKKSAKNPQAEELEEMLSGVMVLFKYLEDNDVFQKFYSKMVPSRQRIIGCPLPFVNRRRRLKSRFPTFANSYFLAI